MVGAWKCKQENYVEYRNSLGTNVIVVGFQLEQAMISLQGLAEKGS